MHFEFCSLLRAVLSRPDCLPAVPEISPEKPDLSHFAESVWFMIEPCPPKIEADLSTSVCFELSALLRKVETNILPGELAPHLQSLLQDEQKVRGQELFQIDIGGPGYLNISATTALRQQFLQCLTERGAEQLLSSKSLFVARKEDSPELTDRLQFCFRWEVLQRRAQKVQNEDLHAVLARNSVDGMSSDDRWMVLALLDDPELEAQAYLSGFGGRENIPWVFQRFQEDVIKFIEILSMANANTQLAPRMKGDAAERLQQALLRSLQRSEDRMLHFRGTVARAHRLYRPELLAGTLLRSVREFYSFYNLPACRQPHPRMSAFPLMESLAKYSKISADLVRLVLRSTEFSC